MPTISLYNNQERFTHFEVTSYEDTSAKRTFKEIQKQTFVPSDNSISKGYSKSTFWYRFKIDNKSLKKVTYYVTFAETFQDKVHAYIQNGDEFLTLKKGPGNFQENKTNILQKPVFEVALSANEEKTIYLSLSAKFPNFTAFYIYNKNDLFEYLKYHDLIYMFFIGALMSLILYNLTIYFFSRDRAYLFYVLHVGFFLLWQLHITGMYPMNRYENTGSYYLVGMTVPLMLSYLLFFSCSILELKTLFTKWCTFIKALGYFYIIIAFASIIYLNEAFALMHAITIFVLPLLLYLGIKSYFAGNKTARFYVIAQIIFLFTSTLFSIAAYGWLPYNLITRHGIIVGSFFEIILFALALAYRIRTLQKDKIRIIEQSNKELDEKVKQRTKELEDSKEKLKELASKDPLTNLYNRRSLFEISAKIVSLAKREKQSVSVMIFDIDMFKSINDTYGHKVGDHVIKSFSEILNQTRDSDITARIGGEEFVILLPNTNIDGAVNIANKILEKTRNLPIQVHKDIKFHFTASCGVDSLRSEDEKIEDVIYRADEALYKAKRSGRDKVEFTKQ